MFNNNARLYAESNSNPGRDVWETLQIWRLTPQNLPESVKLLIENLFV